MRHYWKTAVEGCRNNPKAIRFAVSAILAVILTVVFQHFPGLQSAWKWLLIFASILLVVFTALFAGLAVFRPLAAVSGGLSLSIYLAERYCSLPPSERTADDPARLLFVLGTLYLVAWFFGSTWKECRSAMKHFKDANNGKISWLMAGLYVLFVVVFIWQLLSVMHPIIRNMCIFKG